jgi:hypothetical protein
MMAIIIIIMMTKCDELLDRLCGYWLHKRAQNSMVLRMNEAHKTSVCKITYIQTQILFNVWKTIYHTMCLNTMPQDVWETGGKASACNWRGDRLCGLVVRVPGYRSRGPGFDSGRYQIFWEVVDLERGPLSLVNTTEELLGWKSSGSGV